MKKRFMAALSVLALALALRGDRDHAALRRHTRLVLRALDELGAGMREFGRFEHRAQAGAAAGIAKRRKRDDDYHGNNRNRHVTMPARRIKTAAASGTTANVTKRAIVLEL